MIANSKWTAVVIISQAGGKYGSLDCPVCGRPAHWKFTQSTGWCESCLSSYFYSGGLKRPEGHSLACGDLTVEIEVEKQLFGLSGMAGNLLETGGHIRILGESQEVEVCFARDQGALVNDRIKRRIEGAIEAHLKQGPKRFIWTIHEKRSVQ